MIRRTTRAAATPPLRTPLACRAHRCVCGRRARLGVLLPLVRHVSHDGAFQHWAQRGHAPPNDIASSYYPARGLYSSSDQLVVSAQMDEIRAAGIDEIAVSWWGKGSAEDARLPTVVAAARADWIAVAVHLEPYPGRTVATTVDDLTYLRGYGVRTFYVYRALDLPIADW